MSAAFRMAGGAAALELHAHALWEAGCTGVAQEGEELVAYFSAPVALPLTGRWEAVAAKDWVAEYYAGLEPIEVGRLVVVPTHRQALLRAGQRALWLDPGMAFGSGHHATTRLALEALEGLELSGLEVLDVGAGSGVLAIAADLLGAERARGVDTDPQTVPVARANAALNLSRARFAVGALGEEKADVIAANLYAELHAELAPRYARALRPGGALLVTGILAEREGLVQEALRAHLDVDVLDVTGRAEREGWVLLTARRAP